MIDIIIPVYNTPYADLERCLKSVENQTYKDYKVYIIDDGSKESTKKQLDSYIAGKTNFTVKHIANAGVSNARNLGIEVSNSKYLTFLDADDTIEENFLEEAFHLIEDYNLDLIIGGYHEIKNGEIVRTRTCTPGLHLYNHLNLEQFFEKLLSSKTNETNRVIGDCPTGRIYTRLFRRDSIGPLRFNTDIKMSEDTLFMIDYMYNNPTIGIIDRVWYNYYINDYSISNGTKKEKLITNIKGFIKEIEKRYKKEKNDTIKDAYLSRVKKANNYIEEIKNTNS